MSNGSPMTPEDRGLWLLKHKVPAGYLLVTKNEIDAIGRGLAQEHDMRVALQANVEAIRKALGDYWKNEPDLPNAAGAAAFDAARGTAITDNAREALQYALSALIIIAHSSDEDQQAEGSEATVGEIIKAASDKLGDALAFIDAKRAERRDRTKGTQ